MDEVTVDTNVFVHATNSTDPHCSDSCAILDWLQNGTACLCVDPNFSKEEARNGSAIVREYLEFLRSGMVGYEVVAYLFASGRVKAVSRTVAPALKKIIEQGVPDKTDRIFAKVAWNGRHKILASNDLRDFRADVRTRLKKQGLGILLAAELRKVLRC